MKLSASEFDELKPLLSSWSRDRVEMARLYLVEQVAGPTLAATYGCTKQSVQGAAKRALEKRKKIEAVFEVRAKTLQKAKK